MTATEQSQWMVKREGGFRVLMRMGRNKDSPRHYLWHIIWPVPVDADESKMYRLMKHAEREAESLRLSMGCEVEGPHRVSVPTLDPSYEDKYAYGIEIIGFCPYPADPREGGNDDQVTRYPSRYPNL